MKNQETIENNRLIAEFMGLTPVEYFGRYSVSLNHCTANEKTAEEAINGFASIAKFNSLWEWLMPVVHKCLEICHFGMIYEWENSFADKFLACDINVMYKEVTEFIKWHNANK